MSPTQDPPSTPSRRGLLGIAPDQLDRFTATISVRFMVGHDRTEFSIHPDLLSSLSAPLTTLVNETKGSLEGYVTCEDVDKDVFSRFLQFVYTGAYTGFLRAEKDGPDRQFEEVSGITASMGDKLADKRTQGAFLTPSSPCSTTNSTTQVNNKDSSDSTTRFGGLQRNDQWSLLNLPFSLASYRTAAMQRPGSGFGISTSALCKQHQPGSRRSSKRKFGSTTCDCGPYQKKRDFVLAFVEKCGGTDPGQIIWQAMPKPETASFDFIGHVRIWVFADRFAITSLMDLASSQLAYELTQWTIRPSAFIPEFSGLIRYAYGNHIAGGSQVRQIVAQFAACVVEDVSGLEGWSTLLKEVPNFATDLVDQMTSRLGWL